jgi:hypothetical protein
MWWIQHMREEMAWARSTFLAFNGRGLSVWDEGFLRRSLEVWNGKTLGGGLQSFHKSCFSNL